MKDALQQGVGAAAADGSRSKQLDASRTSSVPDSVPDRSPARPQSATSLAPTFAAAQDQTVDASAAAEKGEVEEMPGRRGGDNVQVGEEGDGAPSDTPVEEDSVEQGLKELSTEAVAEVIGAVGEMLEKAAEQASAISGDGCERVPVSEAVRASGMPAQR